MALSLPFVTMDVFTTTVFKGNQLAIVHLPSDSSLSQSLKQAIAREFNFSETVFLHAPSPEDDHRRLDIFTITQELPFAGHPTIGTICHVCQSLGSEQVKLRTKAGPVTGKYHSSTEIGQAEIPHDVRIHHKLVPRKAILASQTPLVESLLSGADLPLVSVVRGASFVLVELPSLSPWLESLIAEDQKICERDIYYDEGWAPSFTGVYYYVIVSRGEVTEIRVRMLEPSIGEDAATGAAACTLAAYLSLQDGRVGGRTRFRYGITQGVEMGRESRISVDVELNASGREIQTITLAGSAVLVTEGKLHCPG